MAIAFFDLDRTLISENSGKLWVRSELRQGHITRWQAIRAFHWLLRYQFGLVDLEDALISAISNLEGLGESEMHQRSLRFYRQEVRPLFRPGAFRALSHHRRAGDKLVLLSSTSPYLAGAVREELELDDALCNHFEVDAQGVFTGKAQLPLCYGKGKLAHARQHAEGSDVTLAECSFYTDSSADLPALEAMGRPIAVNPDPRLQREARGRGWEIVDWGRP